MLHQPKWSASYVPYPAGGKVGGPPLQGGRPPTPDHSMCSGPSVEAKVLPQVSPQGNLRLLLGERVAPRLRVSSNLTAALTLKVGIMTPTMLDALHRALRTQPRRKISFVGLLTGTIVPTPVQAALQRCELGAVAPIQAALWQVQHKVRSGI